MIKFLVTLGLAGMTILALLTLTTAFGQGEASYTGMCEGAAHALSQVHDASVEELDAAINAVYEAEMRCMAR